MAETITLTPVNAPPEFVPMLGGDISPTDLAANAPLISGITTRTIFTGVQNVTAFNHQVKLVDFGGLIWACWSQSAANEGEVGSHVVYSTSADGGMTWSAVQNVTPVNGARVDVPTGGWWVRNGELYCLYYTDTTGSPHSTNLTARYRKWNGSGWDAETTMFTNFLVHYPPIPAIEADGSYVLMGWDNAYNVKAYRGDLGAWTQSGSVTSQPAVVDLQEMTVYRLHNMYAAIFRQTSGIPFEFRAFSTNGVSWSKAKVTTYPQAAANHFALRLSNGKYVFANNPNQDGTRIPLMLGVSDDGLTFTRFGLVRNDAISPRYPGTFKSNGCQYPHMIEKNGNLLVGYSANKEDIQVSIIPIANLP